MKIDGLNGNVVAAAVSAARAAAQDTGDKVGPAVSSATKIALGKREAPPVPSLPEPASGSLQPSATTEEPVASSLGQTPVAGSAEPEPASLEPDAASLGLRPLVMSWGGPRAASFRLDISA